MGSGRADAVKLLVAHGANVNAAESLRGQTALMWAVAEPHQAVAQVLVEGRADVKASTNKGFTPLMFAARNGDPAKIVSRAWDQLPDPIDLNAREWREATITSASGHGNARGVARIFAALAGGERDDFLAAEAEGRRALPDCLPNPPVGCVLVADDRVEERDRAAVRADEQALVGRRRRGLPAVPGDELAAARVVVQQERPAADPRGLGLDERQHHVAPAEAAGGEQVRGRGAEADRRADRLAGQHVGSIQFAADDPIELGV